MSDNSRIDQVEHVQSKASTLYDRVVNVSGDTANRFQQLISGAMSWGNGTAAPDTNLYRNGVNALNTDHQFTAALGIATGVVAQSSDDTIANGTTSTFGTTTAAVYTLAAAVPGVQKILCALSVSATTTLLQYVKAAAGATFDGTNNVAAFNTAGSVLDLVASSSTRWIVTSKSTTVALSTST